MGARRHGSCGTAHDTAGRALQHGRACAATRLGVRYDTTGQACVATRPARRALRHDHDTAEHRPMTRSRHGRPGCSARGLCSQAGSGCAHCTANSVLTQCTVFNHCLDTVHEHCSQDFSKK